jgi:hypothetical protein
MDGELTYNQALDITIANKAGIDSHRLFTLAELYFPSAHGSLDDLKSVRDELARLQTDFKEQYRLNGAPSQEHSEAMTLLLQRFDRTARKYQAELTAYARNA